MPTPYEGGDALAVFDRDAETVARELLPQLEVYAVQAAAAPMIHDSWHAGRPTPVPAGPTIAEGLATRETYEMTFATLCEGLTDFITVTEAEIAEAIRILLRTTHNLSEGAGSTALAGLIRLRERLAGKTVGTILSGSNIDAETLRRVVTGEL